jgi:hypothetical protein
MIRMVSDGRVHESDPAQRFHDAGLAAGRAPDDVVLDVAEYVLRYLRDGLRSGEIPQPTGEAADRARVFAGGPYSTLFEQNRGTLAQDNPDHVAVIEGLRDEVLALLGASTS